MTEPGDIGLIGGGQGKIGLNPPSLLDKKIHSAVKLERLLVRGGPILFRKG